MANDEMISLVHEEASDRMSKALQRTKAEFAAVRTGRASSSLLERIPVDYYGAIVPLQQLAGFTVPVRERCRWSTRSTRDRWAPSSGRLSRPTSD